MGTWDKRDTGNFTFGLQKPSAIMVQMLPRAYVIPVEFALGCLLSCQTPCLGCLALLSDSIHAMEVSKYSVVLPKPLPTWKLSIAAVSSAVPPAYRS